MVVPILPATTTVSSALQLFLHSLHSIFLDTRVDTCPLCRYRCVTILKFTMGTKSTRPWFDPGRELFPELSASVKTLRSLDWLCNHPTPRSFCGRGKPARPSGNCRLRMLAGVRMVTQAGRKLAKSTIVANIVDVIRQGGWTFLKFEKAHGSRLETTSRKGERLFRDSLHDYRSSAKAKTTGGLPERAKTQYAPISTTCWCSIWITRRHGRKAARFLGFDRSMELDFFK
jgi:hypothetical protein